MTPSVALVIIVFILRFGEGQSDSRPEKAFVAEAADLAEIGGMPSLAVGLWESEIAKGGTSMLAQELCVCVFAQSCGFAQRDSATRTWLPSPPVAPAWRHIAMLPSRRPSPRRPPRPSHWTSARPSRLCYWAGSSAPGGGVADITPQIDQGDPRKAQGGRRGRFTGDDDHDAQTQASGGRATAEALSGGHPAGATGVGGRSVREGGGRHQGLTPALDGGGSAQLAERSGGADVQSMLTERTFAEGVYQNLTPSPTSRPPHAHAVFCVLSYHEPPLPCCLRALRCEAVARTACMYRHGVWKSAAMWWRPRSAFSLSVRIFLVFTCDVPRILHKHVLTSLVAKANKLLRESKKGKLPVMSKSGRLLALVSRRRGAARPGGSRVKTIREVVEPGAERNCSRRSGGTMCVCVFQT